MNALYFVGDVGSINAAASTARLPRLSPSAAPSAPASAGAAYSRALPAAVTGGQGRKRKPYLLSAALCTDNATIGQPRSTPLQHTWGRGASEARGARAGACAEEGARPGMGGGQGARACTHPDPGLLPSLAVLEAQPGLCGEQ